jgi:hypothetical protein
VAPHPHKRHGGRTHRPRAGLRRRRLTSNSTLRIGAFDKFNAAKVAASGSAMDTINYVDTAGSVGQDMSNTAVTGKWAAFTEFINVDSGSQEWTWASILHSPGTALSIPIGWVPNVALNYGGIIAMNQISAGFDRFGGIAYDTQIIFLLDAFPLIGIALGFGFGNGGYGKDYQGNTGWFDSFQGFLHNNFSLQDK